MAVMTEIASLVLFTADCGRTAEFYRAIGLDLGDEQHGEGPVHFAAELDGVHFAVYQAESAERAPARLSGGSSFPGFYVASLDDAAAALAGVAAPLLSEHEEMPWGSRIVAEDPDGRPVEINQRGHCSGH
jgi:lactoylglutathione lyase